MCFLFAIDSFSIANVLDMPVPAGDFAIYSKFPKCLDMKKVVQKLPLK